MSQDEKSKRGASGAGKGAGAKSGSKSGRKNKGDQAERLPPALKALAEAGVTPADGGRNWVRVMQGAILEGGERMQARLTAGGFERPPMVNRQQAEDAALVMAWFESHAPQGEALAALEQMVIQRLSQAREAHPTEAGRLERTFKKALAAGLEWARMEEDLEALYRQWEGNAKIRSQASELEDRLNLKAYPSLYPLARSLGRKVSLFIGPTNSGKTHAAMERLAKGESGAYLAPLRLLALEGQEALSGRGVPCSLITGEERKLERGASFVASTVEMANFSEVVDCAVVDEGQMLADKDRGWAWTAAICAMPARELVIVAAPEARALIETFLKRLGESYEVRLFERKNQLSALAEPLSDHDARDGDALIAFSRKNALMWRERMTRRGKSVAVIYGALAPEVRRAEAARFCSGEAQVLVATDAIGMGLNLPIKRVIFTAVSKFDGTEDRVLGIQELRQIAGRAGRFGLAERGEAAAMDKESALILKNALEGHSPELTGQLSIAPSDRQLEVMSQALGIDLLNPLLCFFRDHLVKSDPLFKASEMEDMVELAWRADKRLDLSLEERFTYARAPIDRRDEDHLRMWEGWMRRHERADRVAAPPWEPLGRGVADDERLWEYERAMKVLAAYSWLSWRFEEIYTERALADERRAQLSGSIEEILAKRWISQSPTGFGGKKKPGSRK